MVRIEIELLGEKATDDIYDLRNFLKEKLPEIDFAFKEQPPLPGQMGILLEPILGGILHATSAIILEEIYRNLLKPVYDAWIKSRQRSGSKLEIMSSLKDSEEKVNFVEDSNGKTQVYDFNYAIDTDKTMVLLIGAGKFTSDFNPIPPVKGNLEDLYKLLTDKTHIGIPRENVSVSFDEPHVEIQKRLLQAARKPDIQTLIIYFAGHGHRSDVKKLSLIACDTEKIGDEVIGGIDFDFVSNKILKGSAAKQKILILDTCHSGIATQGEDDIAAGFDVKGSYILTSSPGDDVSYFEKDARNTYFTSALLDILQNGIDNTRDMLALSDLYEYTTEVMEEKKFPLPHARNELNIQPSNFFIARNPSFSGEKLKWKADGLFKDGKLQEALDQYRGLLKLFPDDTDLRKHFEDCESELSFTKYVNDANSLFYEKKNYPAALALYKKAYALKRDVMVLDKIRQCEKPPTDPVAPDPQSPIKADLNFQAFQKAMDRKAFFAASQYLKKVKQSFPASTFVNETMAALQSQFQVLEDPRRDDRLTDYFSLLDKGELSPALIELKSQLSNDPEYPVFLRLQRDLQRKINEQKNSESEEEKPRLFRLFQTLGTKWKAAALVGLGVLIITVIGLYFKEESKPPVWQLRNMLFADSTKAISLLTERMADDDSAKLVLGEYFRNEKRYTAAFAVLRKSPLTDAKIDIYNMYVKEELYGPVYEDSMKDYFTRALSQGPDTIAFNFLGYVAYNKFLVDYNNNINNDPNHGLAELNPNWREAIENFKASSAAGSAYGTERVKSLYHEAGVRLNKTYNDPGNAYHYFRQAAHYGNKDAMCQLGLLYAGNNWHHNLDSAQYWYTYGMRNNDAASYNNYGVILKNKDNTPAGFDAAFPYYTTAHNLDPNMAAADYNLGSAYYSGGIRVLKNRDSAIKYFSMAYQLGDTSAYTYLHYMGAAGY